MKHLLLGFTSLCLCVFLPSSVVAQWPTQADQNLLICDRSGEQTLPKIRATSDGGCYVVWYDHASGNYDVYLQRLDGNGVIQWQVNGILISDNPQNSWITDWDMTVDLEDHCIIAVNDVRAGTDWDIYGYRISPAGEFVWGDDGIAISNNDGFEPDPRVCVTTDGGIVFTWQEETAQGNVVNLRKLTTAGTDMFSPATLTLTSEYGLSIPRITPAENGSVILQFLEHQGTEYWRPRHIYMQKYDSIGVELWFEDPTAVMTTNGIGIQMEPDVLHDGSGGAYSFWYDTRNMIHHCYVQHVNNMGVAEWTTDGVQTDMSASELQMNPALTVASDGVVVFYAATNSGQTQGGMQVQKLNTSGVRLWGENGIVLIPLMTDPTLYLYAFQQGSNSTVAYGHYVNGSALNWVVRAIQVDNATGAQVWNPSPRDLCSVESDKGHLNITVNPFDQILAAWPDSRIENGDIYVQNINPDGSLGPLGEPPPAISFISPLDGETITGSSVVVEPEVSNFVVAGEGGDGIIEFSIDGELEARLGAVFPYSSEITPGTHTLRFELVDYDYNPLDPSAYDEVTITVVILPPSIEITSPVSVNDTAYIGGLETEIVFNVENFVVGESEGDGQVDFWLFGFHLAYLNNTNSIPITFMNHGTHEVRLELVDFDHQPLDPPVYDVIWINTGNPPPPTIEITSPEDWTGQIEPDSIQIEFDVNHFEVAEGTGDGYIFVFSYYTSPGGETEVFTHFFYGSTDPFNFQLDEIGTYDISLSLVDNDSQQLDPPVADTVHFVYGTWAADELPDGVPSSFVLHAAYPNPFNPETTIRFDVASPALVLLTVHDLLGREVAVLLNEFRDAGQHSVVWQGTNSFGQVMPSGVYFVKMDAGSFQSAQKVMLVK